MMTPSQIDPFIFWAKTSQDKENFPNAFHPLMCHMIDVAVVTQSMWQEVLPQAAKKPDRSSARVAA